MSPVTYRGALKLFSCLLLLPNFKSFLLGFLWLDRDFLIFFLRHSYLEYVNKISEYSIEKIFIEKKIKTSIFQKMGKIKKKKTLLKSSYQKTERIMNEFNIRRIVTEL